VSGNRARVLAHAPEGRARITWNAGKVSEAIGLELHPVEELERSDLIVVVG